MTMSRTFRISCGFKSKSKSFISRSYCSVPKKVSYVNILESSKGGVSDAVGGAAGRPKLALLPASAANNGFERLKLLTRTRWGCNISHLQGILVRHYCSGHDDFPALTRLKCRGYPTALASFSNFCLTYLVIKPRLDASFSANEFLLSTKKVVEIVSSRIAESNFEALKHLVTADVLQEIETNVPKFSVSQRQDIAIAPEELVYSFLDAITLKIDDDGNTKWLEILTIHHAFKGIEEIKKVAENYNPFNTETPPQDILKRRPRPFVLNYRFSRKFYSTGEADDWIINGLQHQSGKSMSFKQFF